MGPQRKSQKFLPVLLLVVWATLSVAAFWLVRTYSDNVPGHDEWSMVRVATGNERLTWSWLAFSWAGHRVILVRLLLLGLYRLTNFDFRAGCYLSVALLSVAALAVTFAIASIDGKWHITSIVPSFVLLSWIHWYNWLFGWQLQFVLSVCLSAFLLVFYQFRCRRLFAICLLLLPLCGANGVLMALPVAFWLVLTSPIFNRVLGAFSLSLCTVLLISIVMGEHKFNLRTPFHVGIVSRFQDYCGLLGGFVAHYTNEGFLREAIERQVNLVCLLLISLLILLVKPTNISGMGALCFGLIMLLTAWQLIDFFHIAHYEMDIFQLAGLLLLIVTITALLRFGLTLPNMALVGSLLCMIGIAATRSMVHPNYYARYPLLLTPIFIALALQLTPRVRVVLLILSVICFVYSFQPAIFDSEKKREYVEHFVADPFQVTWIDEDGLHPGKYGDSELMYFNPYSTLEKDLAALRSIHHPMFKRQKRR